MKRQKTAEISAGMKRQKTAETARERKAASTAPDSSSEATSPSPWQMGERQDRCDSNESMLAAYSFTVPSLPGAAESMPWDIVRFVEFVPGENGRHTLHNVAVHMLNDNWIFFGRAGTGEWRPGKWTWQKQEPEVLMFRFDFKQGIGAKTTWFQRNAIGWFVSKSHVRACETRVLCRLPATNTGESSDLASGNEEVA